MSSDKYKILIVDDEKNIRRTLSMILSSENYSTEEASCAKEALEKLKKDEYDLILLDVKLPDNDGIRMIDEIRVINPSAYIIMISGHANIQNAVEAIKKGAYDFFEKPLDRERVLLAIRHCIEKKNLYEELMALRALKEEDEIIGKSEKILEVLDTIKKVSPTNARVFITGESGTGKELVAKSIHQNSKRKQFPFIKVNCAAIPSELIESELFGFEKGAFSGASEPKKGLIELADKGTLFLDEIADMSLAAQAKILRVLQTGEFSRLGSEKFQKVDIRVIAATNKDIKRLISEEKFREDLFFRLNVVQIHMPPLRERREDIPLFVETFINSVCRENGIIKKRIQEGALKKLMDYSWPGNVRELKNVIESIVILSDDIIEEKDLPEFIFEKDEIVQQGTLKKTRDEIERKMILDALEKSDWIIARAARILGIERTTLHKRIKVLGISRQKFNE
ncbi:MAG: sigma-54-dependent transcriptional regulator [Myxococcota bacterium]